MFKERKKILIIGGVTRSLINFRGPLLQCLQKHGHTVLAAAPEDDRAHEVMPILDDWGIPFSPVPMARGGMNPLEDLRTLQALRELIRKHKPDVVIAYTAKPVIYAGLALRMGGGARFFPMITGLGYAFTEGGGLRRRLLNRVTRVLYRLALASADRVIFQNPDDQGLFLALGLVKDRARTVRVYGSGVDMEWYPRQPLPKAPVFLMLARLLADKGVREYADAAKRVKQEVPQARFLLGGALDANPASVGQAELDQWEAEGVLEYRGRLADVRPALAECRFYVLPSHREGTPRSVLEAMATGRPVITTDAPGCRETVEHGVNGLLVRPRDVDSLYEAMMKVLEMPDESVESMGDESLRLVRERFDVNRVNEQILSVTSL
ncbi:glycosyltransferase family 4 protein [Ectothiorhodospira variabilis]|uniref:glycosyltransferase family 4 protein n=1 Tax=Ectothiorhodospira variabilis TaxID=505694 RepID=UPI001EFB8B1A|nr:glycosyltransferase family 4 protein [Ectothiorhodospira variabilis]MCG5495461.1 glycosyltransferase family 4 protein [Ectothiorhodospira variabilis]MCG5505059.1 glycosyltransferase family 4 protein [Ectothiorhodospira variabilis]MCG5508216.1 glycosyltransferase family 4 protein [Ectothiorhodospira variabilis]